jgi:hypothetical protein
VFTGTLRAVNAALQQIAYSGGTAAAEGFDDGITVAAVDAEGAASVALYVPIAAAVGDAPPLLLLLDSSEGLTVAEDASSSVAVGTGLTVTHSDVSPFSSLDVTVAAVHGAQLEVQTVTTSARHRNAVQRVEVVATGGTFKLALDCTGLCSSCTSETTAAMPYNIAASSDSFGVVTSGASLQDALNTLPSLRALRIEAVVLREALTATAGWAYTITYFGAPYTLPLVTEAPGTALTLSTAGTAGVSTAAVVQANTVAGSFALSFGTVTTTAAAAAAVPAVASTPLIAHDATAAELTAALLTLPAVRAVDVTRSAAADLQAGYTWTVTFVDVAAGGDLPLLQCDAAHLQGTGAAVIAAEVQPGRGIAALWRVTTFAAHTPLTLQLDFATAAAAPHGHVALEFVYAGTSYITPPIYSSTVAQRSDEVGPLMNVQGAGGVPGIGYGESLQSLIEGLELWPVVAERFSAAAAAAVPAVAVQRSVLAGGTVRWSVTLLNAPYDMVAPVLLLAHLPPPATAVLTTVTAPSPLTGTFAVQVGSKSTQQLQSTATAAQLSAAIAPLLYRADAGTGIAAVARSPLPDLQGGHTWTIALVKDVELPAPLFTASSSLVLSAGVSAELVRSGGSSTTTATQQQLQLTVTAGVTLLPASSDLPPGSLRLRGAPLALTQALQSLTYTPVSDWHGDVSIVVRAQATQQQSTALVSSVAAAPAAVVVRDVTVTAVSDAPRLLWCGVRIDDSAASTPPLLSADEGSQLRLTQHNCSKALSSVFNVTSSTLLFQHTAYSVPLNSAGLSLVDVDTAGLGAVTVTVTVEHGGLYVVDELLSAPITGSAAAVNDVLQALEYRAADAHWHGIDHITVTASSDASNSDISSSDAPEPAVAHIFVTVAAVDDIPVLIVPEQWQTVTVSDAQLNTTVEALLVQAVEDTPFAVTAGIALTDADISGDVSGDAPLQVSVELKCAHCTLALPPPAAAHALHAVQSNGTSLSWTASVAVSNAALAAVTYSSAAAHWHGLDVVTLTVNDMGNSGKGPAAGLTAVVHLAVAVSAVSDAPVILLPTVNTVVLLHAVEDETGMIGTHPLIVRGNSTLLSEESIQIADADVSTELVPRYTLLNNAGSSSSSSSGPVNSTVTVTIDVKFGTLSLHQVLLPPTIVFTAGTTTGTLASSTTFGGPLAAVNTALASTQYRSALNWHSGGGALDEISITVTDADGSATSSQLFVTVEPQNDPPVLDAVGAVYAVNATTHDGLSPVLLSVAQLQAVEDEPLSLRGIISVRDVDLAYTAAPQQSSLEAVTTQGLLEVSLLAVRGELSLSESAPVREVTRLGKRLTFLATPANANAALAGAVYTADADYWGTDSLVVAVSDLGNSGSSMLCASSNSRGELPAQQHCALHDAITIPIAVAPRPDAPTVTVPATAVQLNEDTDIQLTGITVTEHDGVYSQWEAGRWLLPGTTSTYVKNTLFPAELSDSYSAPGVQSQYPLPPRWPGRVTATIGKFIVLYCKHASLVYSVYV